jgi:dehydrogenase/reductase SDR family protein 4
MFLQNFGHIDILVSNAAANPTVDGILEMKEAVLDKLWDINVKASILLLQVGKFFLLLYTLYK